MKYVFVSKHAINKFTSTLPGGQLESKRHFNCKEDRAFLAYF